MKPLRKREEQKSKRTKEQKNKGVFSFFYSFALLLFCSFALLFSLITFVLAQSDGADLLSRIGTHLMCTCPCSHSLGQCGDECGEAPQHFAEIKNLLAGGKTEQDIYAIYEKKYGVSILAVPKAEGFNLLVWVLPFVGLAVGTVVVVTVVKKLKQEEPAISVEKAQTLPMDEKYRKLLEKELHD